ncbi:ABC transporter substrate-binding protein [Streptomyces coeruleofuscus]|uniref:ABC transporter substrate-binding protein n=1 Tax=Streptomyces coeruleofuscus TaxID=66879 RepID=A0ABN3J037_9ACTN
MTACFRQAVFVPPPVCVVAHELGFFAYVGLEVETVLIESSTDQRDRLLTDDVDAGVTAIDNLIVWNSGGGDLRVVAQIESTTPLRLVAQPSVRGLEDLRGATLGVDAPDNGFAVLLRHLLGHHGLPSDAYGFEPVGGVRERFEALRSRSIDAAWLGPPLDELAQQEGFVSLLAVEDEVPDFPGQGVVAGPTTRQAGREKLSLYLTALDAARMWLHATEDEQILDVLTRGGYGPASARAALRTRPVSLAPARAGLECVLTMRDKLGMMPDRAPGADDLYDGRPLGLELRP